MYRLILFLTCVSCCIAAQETVSISGTIKDGASGESLISANVFHKEATQGAISNIYGFYSYSAPPGVWTLEISYVGYQSRTITINVQRDTTLDIELQSSLELQTIKVTAENEERLEERTQMSSVSIPVKQINKIPALLGERDVLKALQLMPGVQSGGEGQAGLYVRGGSPDQNLILLDGVPVYNANHLFGFFSVFSTDALKDVNLIKGGFPARYGGRLSSILDIRLKEGNLKEYHGNFSAGIVAAKGMLEGPIGKNEKTSFLIAGRRTYIDALIRPLVGETGVTPRVYFYDLNAKIRHKINPKNEIFLSTYTGSDIYGFKEEINRPNSYSLNDFEIGWGNLTGTARWNRVWNNKTFSNLTAIYSRYRFRNQILDEYSDDFGNTRVSSRTSLAYQSGIQDIGLKFDVDYIPNPSQNIKMGLSVTHHSFDPGSFDLFFSDEGEEFIDTTIQQANLQALETAAYAEDEWIINDQLRLNLGLHFSSFHVSDKSYFSLQPRISARYLLPNKLSLKASFATMRQYIQLLTNENINLPTDLWLPSTSSVKPQDSWQAALGLAKTLQNGWEISSEIYYKQMSNVISFKEGASLFEFTDWEERVTQGNGESYGLEALIQKKTGKFTGWLGYTLSWSWRQFDDINFGKKYPFRFDRRHDISVVGMYELSPNVQISGTWVFGTGNAVTLSAQEYYWVNDISGLGPLRTETQSNFSSKNNFRTPSYHRMDIGIDFIKEKKHGKRIWSFGAYNLYNRANPFFLFSEREFSNNQAQNVLKQASLFPVIPYINFKYEF